MLVTERAGRVRVYSIGAVGSSLVRTVAIPSVHAVGESGLMGIAVDVDYAANRFVYVCATRDVTSSLWQNEVLRFTVAADGSWTNLIRLVTGMSAGSNHDGCAVEMDPSGKLWVSMGDAGDAFSAQDPNDLNGKILRVNRDGSIPSDNPIMPAASGRSAVYSMGHRNPQGIAFQPGTGRVYAAEHGPNTDDEVNLIVAGGNYGWPCYTGAGNVNSADASCGPAGNYLNPDLGVGYADARHERTRFRRWRFVGRLRREPICRSAQGDRSPPIHAVGRRHDDDPGRGPLRRHLGTAAGRGARAGRSAVPDHLERE